MHFIKKNALLPQYKNIDGKTNKFAAIPQTLQLCRRVTNLYIDEASRATTFRLNLTPFIQR